MFSLKKITTLLFLVLAFSFLSAEIHGKMPGGEPYASWEDGSQDFFVMFNSNIDNLLEFFGEDPNNPQGDSCIEESHFTLTNKHIPEDAIIEKAYLVWMGAVDPSKLDLPTDNAVNFKFVQSENSMVSWESEISVGTPGEGKLLSDPNSFEFESIRFTDDVIQGCSTTSRGSNVKDQELGYFTYRADITDFFEKIFEVNKEVKAEDEGAELDKSIYYGTYSFNGLECTEHDNYRCITTMVSAWAVFFIYRSQGISAKKIYFYDGLSFVQGDSSTAVVGGFELPKDPVVRLTTMVAEGDPGLYEPTIPTLEGIFLKGEGAQSKFRLWNKCNPIVGNYVEVFNSVSSLIHWNPEIEDNVTCVSYENDWMNYGIEVDTFLLDSQKNINLQEHLRKGNTSMEIELSVNQDAILTNFMVISVDNKGSNFDIPPEASDPTKSKLNFPLDREKHFCGCPSADQGTTGDYWCLDAGTNHREFYYFIKVQNWGDEDTGEVRVWDELDPMLNYISGTTEYATNYNAASDSYDDWETIPDKAGGAFPLSGEGVTVSTKMTNCNQNSWTCKDTVLIRYKVKPSPATQKNHVFTNIASIKDKNDDSAYRTNRSYPLRLSPRQCVRDTECPSPTPKMCGGERGVEPECHAGKECADGFICENEKCVDDPSKTCMNSTTEFKKGKNSPLEVIVPKDNNGLPLTVGQFTIMSNNCEADRFFNLNAVTLNVTTSDAKFRFTDLQLFHDANGNGVVDDGDRLLANAVMDGRSAKFILEDKNKKFPGKTLNYFLVRANIDYVDAQILRNVKFNFYIEGVSAVEISDLGTAFVNGTRVDFAEFTLEPTGDFFIVSRGVNDPPVPGYDKINTNIPVMQIRTKAISKINEIRRMTIRTSPGPFVKFGEKNGIEKIALFLDVNNNGQGDVKLAEIDRFDNISQTAVFESFSQSLSYAVGEEKHFVIYAKFNMKDVEEGEKPMSARLEISTGGVVLADIGPTIVELPIRSKEFVYICADGDEDCKTPDSPKPSCECTVVSVEEGMVAQLIAMLAAFALMMLFGKGLVSKRSRD